MKVITMKLLFNLILFFTPILSYGQNFIKSGVYDFTDEKGIEFKMSYKNDTLNGPFFIYGDDKKIRIIGHFSRGFRHATQKGYDRDGNLVNEKIFNMGRLESIKIFLPSGELKLKQYIDDSGVIRQVNFNHNQTDTGTVFKNQLHEEGFIKSHNDIRYW